MGSAPSPSSRQPTTTRRASNLKHKAPKLPPRAAYGPTARRNHPKWGSAAGGVVFHPRSDPSLIHHWLQKGMVFNASSTATVLAALV
ncbi:hypothetical protein IAQ61_001045 [Plenodomus lingam]|uniref:uncharacterized protein n=1 Tax=Leptosphaeria maculans TaxID=5022 RepID=UPI003324DF78|nr:hypothetical protein IAQ61_001045 [Plenodomus lingam]